MLRDLTMTRTELSAVRDRCLDQNRQLTLGFLHVNEDRELNLCERLFVDKLPDSDFQDVLRAVVLSCGPV